MILAVHVWTESGYVLALLTSCRPESTDGRPVLIVGNQVTDLGGYLT
jgi:hypothetical protein